MYPIFVLPCFQAGLFTQALQLQKRCASYCRQAPWHIHPATEPAFFQQGLIIVVYRYLKTADSNASNKPFHFFLSPLVAFFSSAGVMRSSSRYGGEQIPPDFGKEDLTLPVISKGKRSYDKYLEKNVEDNFVGMHVIVENVERKQKQYNDKIKYRYIFNKDKPNKNRGSGR